MRKLSRIILGLLALSILLLGAYLLADQVALVYYNQHLSWQLFAVPALTLMAGLALGLGIGAGLRGRFAPTRLKWEGIGLVLFAVAIVVGSSGFFKQNSFISSASVEVPLEDIFVYENARTRYSPPQNGIQENGPLSAASQADVVEYEKEIDTRTRFFQESLSGQSSSTAPTGEDESAIVVMADRLEIPDWDIQAEVVSVPFEAGTWDVSGLGQDIAQLGGINGAENANNLVLAGHVSLPLQGFGPFRNLEKLRPGDQILLFSGQTRYEYEVQTRRYVRINEVSVTYDSPSKQLTLLTCTAWNEDENTYENRLVVVANLISATTVKPPTMR